MSTGEQTNNIVNTPDVNADRSPNSGYLELIIGPMFSGKTSRLIELYHSYYDKGKNVLVINYSEDTRYHSSMLSTHDRVMIPCVFTTMLAEICSESALLNKDVVLINEGQFFPDLFDVVYKMVEVYNKRVYICGLDGDFRRQKFGNLLDLIPLCDRVNKLHSKCEICGKNALFSHRITNEINQVVVGSTNYVPLCRHCYIQTTTITELARNWV